VAWIHTIYSMTGETLISAPSDDPAISISDGNSSVSLRLPENPDHAERFLDLLEAAADNARSVVQERRRHLVGDEAVVGWNGAGASVEAQRG